MPCQSDYLEPTATERAIRHAAQLTVFVLSKIDGKVSQARMASIQKQAGDIYANDRSIEPFLCNLLKTMSEAEGELIIYNAHSKASRELADWWEAHQHEDRKRRTDASKEKRLNAAKKSALAKLTREEKEALEL